MAIGKVDHETITYIGRHRRLQVYAYSFHWSELAIWGTI